MEPELIMEKVAKASGANYNFHKESSKFQDSGPQAPVVSLLWGGGASSFLRAHSRAGAESETTLRWKGLPMLWKHQ